MYLSLEILLTYAAERRTSIKTVNICYMITIFFCDVTAGTETQPSPLLHKLAADCVYRAVAWQSVDQIRYNTFMYYL
jgi:hypothetical protein